MEPFLVAMGISLQALLAGLAGAIVASLAVGSRNPSEIMVACIIGAFTANYVGPVAGSMIGISNNAPFLAFFIGCGGKYIVQAIIDRAKKISFPLSNGNAGGNNAP